MTATEIEPEAKPASPPGKPPKGPETTVPPDASGDADASPVLSLTRRTEGTSIARGGEAEPRR